jgi:hypothetical protein
MLTDVNIQRMGVSIGSVRRQRWLFFSFSPLVENPPNRIENNQANIDQPSPCIFQLDNQKPAKRKKHQRDNNAENKWANLNFRHTLSFLRKA